jgi:catechol 2,3-dioxygenase-like lactoylglutathione lyase family enzyme
MEMTDTAARNSISQIATVIVPVSDQDRAIEFYRDTLGFEKRIDVPFGKTDDERWVEVAPPGAPTTIAIVPPREGEPVGIETRIVLKSSTIDADHAALREQGVEVDSEVARMGAPVPPMFFLRDPDGNRLMVIEQS